MINILFDEYYEPYQRFVLFCLVAAGLIFSLVLHEIGHGYAALISGDKTAKHNGRLSPNPAKHLDPLGSIMLLTVGFGYAKPVPVNPRNFRSLRKGMFLVSIAGITVNLILSFVLSGLYVAVLKFGSFGTDMFLFSVETLYFLRRVNLFLFFFNLLPLFPLDGFHLIESLSRRENSFLRFMRTYSMYILIGLVGVSFIVDRWDNGTWWWQYMDPLGTYLRVCADGVLKIFDKFWGLMF